MLVFPFVLPLVVLVYPLILVFPFVLPLVVLVVQRVGLFIIDPLTAEAEYSINFTKLENTFSLRIH